MWLRKGNDVPILVPETMQETITRCLADGWQECADPRTPAQMPADEPEPTQPQPDPVPAVTPVTHQPVRKVRR